MPSFDIVSTFDIQELDNAVNITAREVTTRYDLRDQSCKISLNKTDKTILAEAKNEMALKAMTDILQNRSVNRKLSIKIFEFQGVESASGMSVRQVINLKEGITKEADWDLITWSLIQNKYLVVGGTRLSLPLHYFDKSFCTEKLIGQYEEAIGI